MQQNQQIFTKILQIEDELKKIKAQIQKKPVKKAGDIWVRINILEKEIDEAKNAVFDFDIGKFVSKQDLASWK